VPTFDDKPLTSIAKGEVDLGGDDVDDATVQGFDALLTWMATTLADDVKEVRLSHRLTSSAAVLVGEAGDLSPTLEKMYRAMGQEPPKVKRTLELNPGHALVAALRDTHAERPDDPALADTARLLHGMALLAEGGELTEPAAFVAILSRQLEKTLG
jgi:molecular chaperone HtpG